MAAVASKATFASNDQDETKLNLCVFLTPLGWMGTVGCDELVVGVFVGHSSAASVRQTALKWARGERGCASLREGDWFPRLSQRLLEYAEGVPLEFDDFQLALPERTPFRDKVLAATRSLMYGETTSYGELAKQVGHPGAARAVGTVMSTNRFPIVIPCHRVLASCGKLGGYTAPSGTDLKQRMLDMEQQSAASGVRLLDGRMPQSRKSR
jgi:methylated-DNA-[protein]-cysteine S-methyltransferase